MLWVAVDIGLDSCRRRKAPLSRRVPWAVNEGETEEKQPWGQLTPVSWGCCAVLLTNPDFSERNPNAEHQHALSSVPSPFPLEVVCAALLCLPTLRLWKQSPAAAPNTGLLKMNIHARPYLNFPKAFCVLWISENSTSLKRTNLLLCQS